MVLFFLNRRPRPRMRPFSLTGGLGQHMLNPIAAQRRRYKPAISGGILGFLFGWLKMGWHGSEEMERRYQEELMEIHRAEVAKKMEDGGAEREAAAGAYFGYGKRPRSDKDGSVR